MSRTAQGISTALHLLFILFLLIWSINPDAVSRPSTIVRIFAPRPLAAPSGGSGMRQPDPPRTGTLPPRTTRVFLMPLIQRTNYVPKLTLPSAVDAPPDIHSTNAVIGLPDGLGNLSAGSGGQAGIGRGDGGLPGDGTGNHFGNGDGLYTPGQGVSMPVPVKTVEPEYSDEGRKARVSGSVLVYAEIDSTGHPRNLKVLRGIGVGLDEKALAAVAQWLFKPGTKGGKAVAVRATFVVNFRLL